MKINQLKCISEINGFTVGNSYPIIEKGVNPSTLSLFDNNMILRRFETIEGASDFKNWFIGETVEIKVVS